MQKPTRALPETPSCNNDYLGITFSIIELNALSQNGCIHAHIHPSIHSRLFLLHINDFRDDIICHIDFYADDDLRDTENCSRK